MIIIDKNKKKEKNTIPLKNKKDSNSSINLQVIDMPLDKSNQTKPYQIKPI